MRAGWDGNSGMHLDSDPRSFSRQTRFPALAYGACGSDQHWDPTRDGQLLQADAVPHNGVRRLRA
eukprot:2170500-Pyramimonas_sp.AAC.1